MGRYRLKEGFGKHYRYNGQELVPVKPGEVIECPEVEISAVIDKFEVVEADKPKLPATQFKLVKLSGGYFNVVHPITNKPINTKALRKDEAEALAGQTIEEYEAKLAAKAEEEKKLDLIEEILKGKECPYTEDALLEKSVADLQEILADEKVRLNAGDGVGK